MFSYIFDSTYRGASQASLTNLNSITGAASGSQTTHRLSEVASLTRLPLSRLAKGAALLACALACIEGASAQSISYLLTGTVSNFSVTASSGSTTGIFSYAPTSVGIYSNLTITAGPGSGLALAVGSNGLADLVGFTISDSVANTTGGGSGSFTMNFTASVLFFDYLSALSITDSPTVWTVPGLGILSDGQTFNPGSYTFNFTTTHAASSTDVAGAAVFIPVPETSPQGALIGSAGVLLVAHSLRCRRSRAENPPSNIPAV